MSTSHHMPQDPLSDVLASRLLSSHEAYATPARVIPFPAVPRAATAAEDVPLRRLSSPHVLVMDGHLEMLDVLGHLLHEEGYSVTLSSRPLALAEIAQVAPEVIVLEAMFEGVDVGRRLAQELRADPALGEVPIICCTIMPELVTELALDGLPTLLKPFDLDALLALLAIHAPDSRAGRP